MHQMVCEDSIRAGESININEALTSAGGNFALGFFSLGISMNSNLQTNSYMSREYPLAKNSHGVFGFDDDGNIVLLHGGKKVIWSSNATIAKLAMNSTVTMLLDTGNLVLRHGQTGTVLWQSFDYPTDTLTPGMKLSFYCLRNLLKVRVTLTPTGQAQQLFWAQTSNSWVVVWQAPVVECDLYGYCGPFSSCEQNGSHPFCSCLEGFVPKDQKEWNLGNQTGGLSLGNMTVSQCESKCPDNCSCTAYAYANLTIETTVHCMNWFGALVDLNHNAFIGKDLYVRLHSSDQVSNAKTGNLTTKRRILTAIAAAAISTRLLFISIIGYVLRRGRLRNPERIEPSVKNIDTNSSASVIGPNDGELLSFSLQNILAATDNFSEAKKLGDGGFGPICKGFEPKYQKEWKLGNWTGGCTRRTTRTCDIGDQFSKLERMKFPDYSVSLGNMTTVSQCELQCSKNCTCAAYAYTNVSSETVSCMHWFGDIVDLKGNYINGEDLYVRNNDSDQVGNGKLTHKSRSVIAIAAAAISTGLLLICSFGYVLRRWMRSRGRVDRSAHELDANSKASVDDLNNGELLLFSLRSILAATDNFSEANKLGEGGYGPVCKGYLPEVQEVAVKKQSKTSLQGTEEFMNELKFIAELQHKNLVRLLGCCVEQEEKILIYKYMCNGSLDKLLFCTHVYLFSETFDKQFLAWENWKQGSYLEFIDPSIKDTCNFKEAMKSIVVRLLCVQEFPGDRHNV
ncbi:unnamed protein product [Camellia sinensis]